MTGECPVCAEDYQNLAHIEMGTRWFDIYGGSPYDFFTRYDRTCHATLDVESDRPVGTNTVVIYCHRST